MRKLFIFAVHDTESFFVFNDVICENFLSIVLVKRGLGWRKTVFKDTHTAQLVLAVDTVLTAQVSNNNEKNRGMTEHEHISLHFYVHMTSL